MPIYSYWCLVHGDYDVIQGIGDAPANCPKCGKQGIRSVTAPARISVNHKQNLPYGNGSRGKFISSKETGGMNIMVPSWGAMDKAEVNYVAEAAVEREKERVRKRMHRNAQTKERLSKYLDLAYQNKEGQRAKAIKSAMKDGL